MLASLTKPTEKKVDKVSIFVLTGHRSSMAPQLGEGLPSLKRHWLESFAIWNLTTLCCGFFFKISKYDTLNLQVCHVQSPVRGTIAARQMILSGQWLVSEEMFLLARQVLNWLTWLPFFCSPCDGNTPTQPAARVEHMREGTGTWVV